MVLTREEIAGYCKKKGCPKTAELLEAQSIDELGILGWFNTLSAICEGILEVYEDTLREVNNENR